MKTLLGKVSAVFWVVFVAMSMSTLVFSQNLIYNGDFEVVSTTNPNFPDNWWIEYCGTLDVTTISIDNTVAHTGSRSIKFTTIAGKTSDDCVVFLSTAPDTLYAGGLYKISYWAKSEGAGVYNVAMNAYWANDQLATPLSGNTDWTYREAIVTFPEDIPSDDQVRRTHFTSLWFNADSCSEAGSAWYDDITIEYLGTPPTQPEEFSLMADYSEGQIDLKWGAATQTVNPIAYYLVKRVKRGAETPNICENPSFEDPNDSFTFPANWYTFFWSSADQQSWAEGVAHTGDFSVTISSELGGHSFISKGLFPPAGTRGFDVYMKAYIKTENVTNGSGAFIDFQGWSGTTQGLYGTHDWTASDAVRANVVPGVPCAVMFGNYRDGRGGNFTETKPTGQAWYDDVSIVLLDSIGQTTGLTFTDTNVEKDATYYYTVRAVDTEGLVGNAEMVTAITTGGNLLYNGDFEVPNATNPDFPDNWWIEYCGTQDVTTIGIDDQVKHSGNYSMKFTTIAGKTSDDCVVMPSVGPDTVYVGGLYKFSYWAKTEGPGVYNIAINPLGWEGNIAQPLVGTNDWTYREGIFQIPDWYADWDMKVDHFLSLWFNADSCGEAGSAWYDDIMVEYIGTPPTAPKNLVATPDGGKVNLNWGPAAQATNPVKYYLVKKVMKGVETPNICPNPSFEDPNDSFTFPAGWSTFFWASADMDWAEGVARTGDFSATMSATEVPGHAFISTGLYPPEGTRGFDVYMQTYIKTENVVGGGGAFIEFQGWYTNKRGLYGTNDWTADGAVRVNVTPGTPCAMMFGNYGDSWGGDYTDDMPSGQAWYDDVSIVLFDSIGQASGTSFTDEGLVAGETYYYSVRAVDNRGLFGPAIIDTVVATASAIGDDNVALPMKTELVGNYPNPFNPNTTIMFNLVQPSKVQISVYNVLGQRVAEVVNRDFQAGNYRIQWNADPTIPSGVYLYEMRTNGFTQVKKMILMR